MNLDVLLRAMVERSGSDLHLTVGTPPKARIHGTLEDLAPQVLSDEAVKACLKHCLTDEQVRTLVTQFDVDALYHNPALGRFRVNAFRQLGTFAVVLRHIPSHVPTLDDLGLPPVLKGLASLPRGIVLVTGTTGSGKSTTLAAMIDHINDTESANIITIEDPVEFVHASRRAVIRQRNLGTDVMSFSAALRGAMRQDPDVILVGEMRDFDTINAAIIAADTGHLVFSTLHTTNAQQTVERILNFYPGDQQEQVRLSLSMNLAGVVAQRLLVRRDGGRIAALEIMISTPTIKKLIREGQVHKLHTAIEEGGSDGMQSFNQVLHQLVAQGLVDLDESMAAASRPEELHLKLKMDGLI